MTIARALQVDGHGCGIIDGLIAAPLLVIEGLVKRYGETPVFQNVSLALEAGEFVALLGESGVGKSTLLNCIAALDRADAGRLQWQGAPLALGGDDEAARWRRRHLGFVFQAFHVLPHLNVAENVALPLLLLQTPAAATRDRVAEVLEAVGLQTLATRMPAQLSGGQLQRVAIARAVVHRPLLILADEPTGNLDPTTAARVLEVLAAQVRDNGSACLMVTHSQAAAATADRVLLLTPNGVDEEITPNVVNMRIAPDTVVDPR